MEESSKKQSLPSPSAIPNGGTAHGDIHSRTTSQGDKRKRSVPNEDSEQGYPKPPVKQRRDGRKYIQKNSLTEEELRLERDRVRALLESKKKKRCQGSKADGKDSGSTSKEEDDEVKISKEEILADRRAANRLSAFQSRQRRKMITEELQKTVNRLKQQNTNQEQQIRLLQQGVIELQGCNNRLRGQLGIKLSESTKIVSGGDKINLSTAVGSSGMKLKPAVTSIAAPNLSFEANKTDHYFQGQQGGTAPGSWAQTGLSTQLDCSGESKRRGDIGVGEKQQGSQVNASVSRSPPMNAMNNNTNLAHNSGLGGSNANDPANLLSLLLQMNKSQQQQRPQQNESYSSGYNETRTGTFNKTNSGGTRLSTSRVGVEAPAQQQPSVDERNPRNTMVQTSTNHIAPSSCANSIEDTLWMLLNTPGGQQHSNAMVSTSGGMVPPQNRGPSSFAAPLGTSAAVRKPDLTSSSSDPSPPSAYISPDVSNQNVNRSMPHEPQQANGSTFSLKNNINGNQSVELMLQQLQQKMTNSKPHQEQQKQATVRQQDSFGQSNTENGHPPIGKATTIPKNSNSPEMMLLAWLQQQQKHTQQQQQQQEQKEQPPQELSL